MDLTSWLSFVTLCTLGAMSPGPSAAVLIRISSRYGRNSGLIAGLAHGIGIGCYAMLAALGLALLIIENPFLFNGLKLMGSAFLIYLGLKALHLLPEKNNERTSETNVDASTSSHWKSFRTGFLLAFLNPKVSIFFLALFSQFIKADTGITEKLILGATAASIDALWYSLVAVLATNQSITKRFSAYGSNIEKVFGVLIILLAIKVAIS
ncbi:MAG: threonine/homoserine/homoserine lactone efflux protein [Oceanicoccus sp.]|jgi:threonine/homoserine/homoserine lactone efflux protein